jgi:hypothetical protein
MTASIAVMRGGVSTEVLVDGSSPPIVLLPSLGRGADAFGSREAAQTRDTHGDYFDWNDSKKLLEWF